MTTQTTSQDQITPSDQDVVQRACSAALDAACTVVQQYLGVTAGDFAGTFFSGANADPLKIMILNYIISQRDFEMFDADDQPVAAESIVTLTRKYLALHGWTAPAQRQDTVAKAFFTAVGVKVATAMCYASFDAPQFVLVGNYESEGRNILSTSFAHIPVGSTQRQILGLVKKFVEDVEAAVGESYARRLVNFKATARNQL